jgi:predicted nucleic acid-binding protein
VNLLLDTTVLSEVQRPAPDLKVLGWLDAVDEDRVFISVASIAELRRGIALMDDGRRRAALAAWLANDLPARFAERILPIDHAIAERGGDLMAQSRQSGVALSAMDGLFAATALARNLTMVTRNAEDFTPFGVPLFNPWAE